MVRAALLALPETTASLENSTSQHPHFPRDPRLPKGDGISTRESLLSLRNDHAPSLLFLTRLGLATPALLAGCSFSKGRCDFDLRELAFPPQRPRHPSLLCPTRLVPATPVLLADYSFPKGRCDFDLGENSFPRLQPRQPPPPVSLGLPNGLRLTRRAAQAGPPRSKTQPQAQPTSLTAPIARSGGAAR